MLKHRGQRISSVSASSFWSRPLPWPSWLRGTLASASRFWPRPRNTVM